MNAAPEPRTHIGACRPRLVRRRVAPSSRARTGLPMSSTLSFVHLLLPSLPDNYLHMLLCRPVLFPRHVLTQLGVIQATIDSTFPAPFCVVKCRAMLS